MKQVLLALLNAGIYIGISSEEELAEIVRAMVKAQPFSTSDFFQEALEYCEGGSVYIFLRKGRLGYDSQEGMQRNLGSVVYFADAQKIKF